jgi:hypothetical protein
MMLVSIASDAKMYPAYPAPDSRKDIPKFTLLCANVAETALEIGNDVNQIITETTGRLEKFE